MRENLKALAESLPSQFEVGAVNKPVYQLEGVQGPGVYGSHQVDEAFEQGHILIHPFNPDQLQGASYDVCLGDSIYRKSRSKKGYFDWTSTDDINDTHELVSPITHEEACEASDFFGFEKLHDDDLVFWIEPGEEIIGHTEEFIGINSPGTTSMHAKSFTGRILIEACKDAGLGDPGYRNRWAMEIRNNNADRTLLVVGMRIAQIVFHAAGPSIKYQDNPTSGSYHEGDLSVAETILRWKPEDMLPKVKETNIRPTK